MQQKKQLVAVQESAELEQVGGFVAVDIEFVAVVVAAVAADTEAAVEGLVVFEFWQERLVWCLQRCENYVVRAADALVGDAVVEPWCIVVVAGPSDVAAVVVEDVDDTGAGQVSDEECFALLDVALADVGAVEGLVAVEPDKKIILIIQELILIF